MRKKVLQMKKNKANRKREASGMKEEQQKWYLSRQMYQTNFIFLNS